VNLESPLQIRLASAGPKRILALDGGGIRGILSLAFAERIEKLLAERTGSPDIHLSDYFDLIGGTSTGAIIAAGLAMGRSASQLIDVYLNLAKDGFRQHRWLGGMLAPKFRTDSLRAAILHQFGEETLGSHNLRCGIGIVAKRLDTGSVWLFHNHPRGPFFSPEGDTAFTANRDLRLVDLLRASTAAPSYFEPESIEVAPGQSGLFVDGGVSPHNNPALLLVMLATLHGFGFRWPMGEDRLMVVSLGTGSPRTKPMWGSFSSMPPLLLAVESLRWMMQDSSTLAQTMLQWMSRSPTPWKINSEIGDLRNDQLAGLPLLHYLRYDVPLMEEWLTQHLGLTLSADELELLKQFDHPEIAPRLLEIGRRAAEIQIQPEHFPAHFDVPVSGTKVRAANLNEAFE
jgi:predicted acylesterase/phospholipase RssA